MKRTTQLQWIEHAEARQVLAAALFERTPQPSWYSTVHAAAAKRLARMMTMIVSQGLAGWPPLQAQPALIRPAAGRRVRAGDDQDYPGSW